MSTKLVAAMAGIASGFIFVATGYAEPAHRANAEADRAIVQASDAAKQQTAKPILLTDAELDGVTAGAFEVYNIQTARTVAIVGAPIIPNDPVLPPNPIHPRPDVEPGVEFRVIGTDG